MMKQINLIHFLECRGSCPVPQSKIQKLDQLCSVQLCIYFIMSIILYVPTDRSSSVPPKDLSRRGGCYFFLSRNAVKRPVEDHVMFMSSHNYSNYEKTAWKFYSAIEMICFHGNAQNTLKILVGKANSIDMLRGQCRTLKDND